MTREKATHVEHVAQSRRTEFRMLPYLGYPVLTERVDELHYAGDDTESLYDVPTASEAAWRAIKC